MLRGGAATKRTFRLLWSGQAISAIGSAVTYLALPLVATMTLRASAGDVGLLLAAQSLPTLLFALFTGVIVDRRSRQQLMLIADILRGVLMLSVPAAYLLGTLNFAHLFVVSFGVAAFNLVFETSSSAYLPRIIPRHLLADANGKLGMSSSTAEIVGPGLAGVTIQLLAPPFALGLDGLSFLWSANCVRRLPVDFPSKAQKVKPALSDIREGLSFLRRHPLLWPLTLSTTVVSFFAQFQIPVLLIFATREMRISTGAYGAMQGVSSAVGLVAAALASRVIARFTALRTLLFMQFAKALGGITLGLAVGEPWTALGILLIGESLFSAALAVFGICSATLRQTVTPNDLLGRVGSAIRLLIWGAVPVAATLGGYLGDLYGSRTVLLVGGAGMTVGAMLLVRTVQWREAHLDEGDDGRITTNAATVSSG